MYLNLNLRLIVHISVKCLLIGKTAKSISEIVPNAMTNVCLQVTIVGLQEVLEYYDDKYVKKWLMRNPVKKDQDIMELYKNMALQ